MLWSSKHEQLLKKIQHAGELSSDKNCQTAKTKDYTAALTDELDYSSQSYESSPDERSPVFVKKSTYNVKLNENFKNLIEDNSGSRKRTDRITFLTDDDISMSPDSFDSVSNSTSTLNEPGSAKLEVHEQCSDVKVSKEPIKA